MGEKDDNNEGQGDKKIKREKKGGEESTERKKKPAAADGGGEKEEDGLSLTTIVLKLDLHCDDCAQKIRRFIKNYNGVEQVKGDSAGGILTVKGNVDPNWLRLKVEKKTQNKVELVFPIISHQPNNKDDGGGGGGGGCGCGGGGDNNIDKKADDKTNNKKLSDDKGKAKNTDDVVNQKIPDEVNLQDKVKPQEKVKHKKHNEMNKDGHYKPIQVLGSTAVLKIPLHCDGCAQKIKRIMTKIDGIENVSIDNDKDLVTIEGTMDMTELTPYLKDRLKRKVDIVSLSKNDTSATEKKGKETADDDNKEKSAVAGGGGGDDKKGKADGGCDGKKWKESNGASGGGNKKDNEGGGGEGKKEKVADGGGDGGGGGGGEKRVDDSKGVSKVEDKGKAKVEESKVEVNKMEYQGYGTPYTYYGVPISNHNYPNQGYGLHTIHNPGYHASTSYVVEYNDPCHHHLHHLHQPQIPPPSLTYLPPPQDHMLRDENPDTCSLM